MGKIPISGKARRNRDSPTKKECLNLSFWVAEQECQDETGWRFIRDQQGTALDLIESMD